MTVHIQCNIQQNLLAWYLASLKAHWRKPCSVEKEIQVYHMLISVTKQHSFLVIVHLVR
jgi:hypothetical protein